MSDGSRASRTLAAEPQSRIIDVGRVALHIREWNGSGERISILLVHGLASNARLWDGAAGHLAELGYHVLAVDQRGHGLSDKPDDGYDMSTVVADAAALIDCLSLDRPVVAGQSWGGNVVIELAHTHSHLVRGVCAVDGGLIQLSNRFDDWDSCWSVLAPPPLAGMPADRFESMIREIYRDWPATAVSGTMANMEELADGTVRPWLSRERHMRILRGLWDHRPFDFIDKVTTPTLFTPADAGDDRSVTKRADYERVVRDNRRIRVEWFSPAHHDLHAQYPERWARTLHSHIAEGFFA